MKGIWQKASFTVEASIWVPLLVFLIMNVVELGIGFFQESVKRDSIAKLKKLDMVQEFYNYQILGEIGEEILDD